jgi:hypothetical protein
LAAFNILRQPRWSDGGHAYLVLAMIDHLIITAFFSLAQLPAAAAAALVQKKTLCRKISPPPILFQRRPCVSK